jgi:putative ABC transport system permease protein
MVLGVALGVAVVVAVDLANESARRAFSRSVETLEGRATHQILGGPSGVPLDSYRLLRLRRLVDAAAPVVEAAGMTLGSDRQALRLLGVDPLADRPFRDELAVASSPGLAAGSLLSRPDGCFVGSGWARRHGLWPGAPLRVAVDGRILSLTVLGLIETPTPERSAALDGIAFLDVGTLQNLLDHPDRLSRIDLIATPDQVRRLRRELPTGLRVASAGERSASLGRLASAFELNLTALSLLALVVAMFLVYNTVTFAVLQRRTVFGTLRTLGATGGQIFLLVLAEAGAAGVAGSIVGHALGYILGQGAVRLVTRTINDLYYVVVVLDAPLRAASVAKGTALGLGTALAAALLPALEAAGVEPVLALRPSTLETASRRWLSRAAFAGLLLAAGGGLALSAPGTPLWADFGALFAVVLGAALVVPLLTLAVMAALRPLLARVAGLLGAMAARTVARSVGRTGLTIAALMTAVAVATGVSLMIGSFRATVRGWLDLTLVADLYVGAPAAGARTTASLPPGTAARIGAVPGVASVETYRRVRVMSSVGEIALGISDARRRRSLALYRFRDGTQHPWTSVEAGALLASEPFARRHHLPDHGGSLTLETDRGDVAFPVAGIFYDYASEEGTVLMSRAVYDRYWNDPEVSSVAVYVAEAVDVDTVADRVRAAVAGTSLRVTPNRSLKLEALRVFDRTFAVTDALRLLALVVAFIGVCSALLSLEVDRSRELATLRALGLTPGQLTGLCLLETGLMGLEAGLLSIPLGTLLAVVLVDVINVRSFGWTMPLALDLRTMATALVICLAAALVAAIYPILRLQRAPVAEALRAE